MSLKLMYITNNPEIAYIAETNGVDWIFIDLEVNGKELRQPNMDTVKSKHSIEDIVKVKRVLKNSKLLVRINPIYENSQYEINEVLKAGADIIMLPYFKTVEEVRLFIKAVGSSAEKCLLLETPEAVEVLDEILEIDGIDYIHIGLNDLHLGYHKKFMFELLSDGTVERIATKIKTKNIKYGFGGIARIGDGTLPAELILNEHYRLKSELVILSRSFYRFDEKDSYSKINALFSDGIGSLREYERLLEGKNSTFFNDSNKQMVAIINNIIARME